MASVCLSTCVRMHARTHTHQLTRTTASTTKRPLVVALVLKAVATSKKKNTRNGVEPLNQCRELHYGQNSAMTGELISVLRARPSVKPIKKRPSTYPRVRKTQSAETGFACVRKQPIIYARRINASSAHATALGRGPVFRGSLGDYGTTRKKLRSGSMNHARFFASCCARSHSRNRWSQGRRGYKATRWRSPNDTNARLWRERGGLGKPE